MVVTGGRGVVEVEGLGAAVGGFVVVVRGAVVTRVVCGGVVVLGRCVARVLVDGLVVLDDGLVERLVLVAADPVGDLEAPGGSGSAPPHAESTRPAATPAAANQRSLPRDAAPMAPSSVTPS